VTKSKGINAPRHDWTKAELDMLQAKYPDMQARALAALLGVTLQQVYRKARDLGLGKSEAFKASAASGRLDGVKGTATRFKPGGVPWSAGKKGLRLGMATEFKPGSVPANVQEVGALRINTLGDIDIKVAPGKGQWLSLRRYVWTQAHGPIPPDMCVMVKDHDPHNTQLENLMLGTRAENVQHNLLRRYPKELRSVMQTAGRLKSQINKLKETADA
jgi:hypothetical protein